MAYPRAVVSLAKKSQAQHPYLGFDPGGERFLPARMVDAQASTCLVNLNWVLWRHV